MRLPLQIFEASDVVFKDETLERKVRDYRRIAWLLPCANYLTTGKE